MCSFPHSSSPQCTSPHIHLSTIKNRHYNSVFTYHFDCLVLGYISRLLLQVVSDRGVGVAGFGQVLDYLDVLGSYSEVQRGVALVVFDIHESFLHLG